MATIISFECEFLPQHTLIQNFFLVGIFTVEKLLIYSNLELQKKTNLIESQIVEVFHAAANYVVTQRVRQASAFDVYTKSPSAIDFQVVLFCLLF